MVIDNILNELEDRIEKRKKAMLKAQEQTKNILIIEVVLLVNIIDMIQKKTEGMSYIGWSVEDFKYQASNQEDPSIYDETKFKDALDTMINKHDASIGITWKTIDIYLDNYCIKETED